MVGEKIGLMGFSHGGLTKMRAIQSNFVQAAKMETMPFTASVMFYPWCDMLQDRIGIPTLILIGSKDDWTPAYQCIELKKKLSKPDLLELIVFEGAYHGYDRQNLNIEYLGHHLVYDPNAAIMAKERTKEFFEKHIIGN